MFADKIITRPKFSIIIPTFNRAYVLWKAILSVQNQSFSDWELILVDDGSTDDTRKLIAEFEDDHRIRYIYQHNQRQSIARNTGLCASTGEIIVYLDSDDEFYPHLLSSVYKSFKNNSTASWGNCNYNRSYKFIDDNFKTESFKIDRQSQQSTIVLQDFYDWNIKTISTGIFHKRDNFIDKISWRSEIFIEDLEFIMQLAVLDPNGFMHIPQSLFNYCQKYGGDGLCSQATYSIWAHSFQNIYNIHKNDQLMHKPEKYLNQVKKYNDLHKLEKEGKALPQIFKYFPELYNKTK